MRSDKIICLGIGVLVGLSCAMAQDRPKQEAPNILFCLADDVSFGHWGAYDCRWIATPGCDYIARNGALFTQTYTPNAKSGPSRSSILTGLNSWQLEQAANHFAQFPSKFKTFTEVLRERGYFVARTGKGWFPGDPGLNSSGNRRELIGRSLDSIKTKPAAEFISRIDYAANFGQFLKTRPKNRPFFFWFGSWEAHRPYHKDYAVQANGRKIEEVDRVPEYLPDCATVRSDMLDYGFEVEYFDSHLSRMIEQLRKENLLDNTIIIVTSDNGMPFPRAKGQSYFDSHRMPMAIMWRGRIERGLIIDDFVSFTDIAPTVLDAASIDVHSSGMAPVEGVSLLPVLCDGERGVRNCVLIGKERHDIGRVDDMGYPTRGVVTRDYMYIFNFEPGRDPAGNPETGFLNYDASPTKSLLLHMGRDGRDEARFWELNFGRRPSEELYDIKMDPGCVNNLAYKSKYNKICEQLKGKMFAMLKEQNDPRMSGNGHIFDQYLHSDPVNRDYYNRLLECDSLPLPNWIVPSDVDWNRLRELRQKKHQFSQQ